MVMAQPGLADCRAQSDAVVDAVGRRPVKLLCLALPHCCEISAEHCLHSMHVHQEESIVYPTISWFGFPGSNLPGACSGATSMSTAQTGSQVAVLCGLDDRFCSKEFWHARSQEALS